VRRSSDDSVLCDGLVMGSSFLQRFRGLMGRRSLPEGEGLYLATSSIHMMFMRFPIDALFLSGEDAKGARRVVGIRENLPPWRGIVMPVRGAKGVVELRAGTLASRGVGLDDVVVFEQRQAPKSEPIVA
jgi:hypothetical protein